MKRHVTLALIGLLVLSLLAGCVSTTGTTAAAAQASSAPAESSTQAAQKVDTVKIAFFNPLTGANADAGKQDFDAAKLAVKHINEQGGIKSLGGAQVELVVADTTSDATQAPQIVERTLSTNKDIVGAVGTGFSGLTLPILPIIEKYQVPIVTNSINDDITKKGYEFVFEPVPKGSSFGGQQVAFINYLKEKENVKIEKVAIIYENSAYGQSTAKGSLAIAEKAGLEVVMNEAFPPNLTDASSLVTALKNSGADAIMPVAYSQDAKLIVNTMKALDYNPIMIGGGAGFLWPVLGNELGENVNGMISVASWNWDSKNISENPDLLKVTEDFEKEYGYFMTEHAGPAYLMTWVIKEGLEKAASTDPIAVRDAIRSSQYTEGPVTMMQPGQVQWDETGWNPNVHAVIIQWQDGKPRTIFPREDSVVEILIPGR